MYPIQEAHLPRGAPPITVASLVSSSTGARLRSHLPKRHVAVGPILGAAMYKRAAQHRLARATGPYADNDIAVDDSLWTSATDIFAAGDCCSLPPALYDNRRERLEGGALPNTTPRLCSAIPRPSPPLRGSDRINVTCRFRSRASSHFQIRWWAGT